MIIKHLLLILLWILSLTACKTPKSDSVTWTKKENAAKGVNQKVADFLTEATDARMMDLAQARLAKERGTTDAVREYAELMMNDQTKLLNEIKTIAAAKNMEVPSAISSGKENALKELGELQGKDFDKKFISMMTLDHRRDVDEFTKATKFEDGDVRTFAKHYLPMIQSHLEKIQDIRKQN